MKRCDFCEIMQIVLQYINKSENINQTDLLQNMLFDSFFQSKESEDFSLDNGLVCKWLNGTAKLSPRIIEYYQLSRTQKALSSDIESLVFPILYDMDMVVNEIHALISNDISVSEEKRNSLCKGYPYKSENEKADFISRILCFTMERSFVKHDAKTKELLSCGSLSPIVKDYIIDGFIPKACKHFCGRDNELERVNELLKENDKLFIQGVAGIGKSELAKKYAEVYKKDYTNILYFTYTGDLKQMIIDCDFSDDKETDNDEIRFKKHNRFLRSLKEDTLIIIDNFNVTATTDSLFDVVMKYRCRILFTSRSRFDNYNYFNLEEISDEKFLMTLVKYFYEITDKNAYIIRQIIATVHCHTLSVELSARLLASGMLTSSELLKKLQNTKTVLNTEDRIGLVKDGTTKQATYYEHIHTLISLACLSEKSKEIMRNMVLVPTDGMNPRMFANWLGLKNLNEINDLIELGFIALSGCRKIALHPLIQEVTVDDTLPSVTNCIKIIDAIRVLSLGHGIDLPYHKAIFQVAENIVKYADKDNTENYLLWLVDVFPYMEKYTYQSGMKLIISELEKLDKTGICSALEKALLLDYKAAYEIKCSLNAGKALQYQKQAVEYCDILQNENLLLVSNLYSNLGSAYLANNMPDKAKEAMETGYSFLRKSSLEYSSDGITQITNYANLAASLGEAAKAINAFESCIKELRHNGLEITSDCANILWSAGLTYLQLREREQAKIKFLKALKIYSEVWADEPELLEGKLAELKSLPVQLSFGVPGFKEM